MKAHRDIPIPGATRESQVLGLRVGDFVEVRTAEEIRQTLDASGALDGMPFMPEMLRYAGRRFRVHKRADKTCDTVWQTRGRRLWHTVHLELRCDGSGHGGCQAGCLLFWKEAWLKRVDSLTQSQPSQVADGPILYQLKYAASRPDPENPQEVLYSCQATQIPLATRYLHWWDVRQYVRDVRSGNHTLRKALFVLGRATVNAIQRKRGGRLFPFVPDFSTNNVKTPVEKLDLQPGEMVQVKSVEEIIATLDRTGRNRGMRFDIELVRWCGRVFRVHSRVEKIINERSGRMMILPNVCIILEGAICTAECSHQRLLCPREIHNYWREIWLRRVPAPEGVVAGRSPILPASDNQAVREPAAG